MSDITKTIPLDQATCGPDKAKAIAAFIADHGSGSLAVIAGVRDGRYGGTLMHSMTSEQLAATAQGLIEQAMAQISGNGCECSHCAQLLARAAVARKVLCGGAEVTVRGGLH